MALAPVMGSDVEEALRHVSPDCPREEWARVLMAVKSGLGDPGEDIARTWSMGAADSYDERAFNATWRSVKAEGGVGIGTLFDLAKRGGWTGPARHNGNHDGNGATGKKVIAGKQANTLWKSQTEADKSFSRLPLVSDDPAALEFFAREYGLQDPILFEDDFRLFDYPNIGPGVVERGRNLQGLATYKFRSFARNDKGKRESRFCFGGDSIILRTPRADGPLVLTAGAEKVLAAQSAGFNVMGLMTGEAVPSAEIVQAIISSDPDSLVIAFDADDPGRKATEGTVQAFQAAGFAPERIKKVIWPKDAAAGFDLNDALKSGGVEAVQAPLDGAKPIVARVFPSFADFIAQKREPLKFYIDGILPEQGKLTKSAPAKSGKTLLLQEFGLCLASAPCNYLGMQFNGPSQVGMVQPELSDALMAARLEWILRTAPAWFDTRAALENFYYYETAPGRPNFNDPQSLNEIRRFIDRRRLQVLLVDSLYMVFPGLEENGADGMALALDVLAKLALEFNLSIILTHHFNKSGTAARGSSVFQGWGDSDLSMAPLKDDPSVFQVDGLFRCSFGKGFPAFWRKDLERTAWLEVMPEGWQPERGNKGGRPKGVDRALVCFVLKSAGAGMRRKDLIQAIQEQAQVSDRTAERMISEAKSSGLIDSMAGIYSLVIQEGDSRRQK